LLCFREGFILKIDGLLGFDSVQKARIQIWLFEQKDLRIEGRIIVSLSPSLIDKKIAKLEYYMNSLFP
jgi:hypothetical protein